MHKKQVLKEIKRYDSFIELAGESDLGREVLNQVQLFDLQETAKIDELSNELLEVESNTLEKILDKYFKSNYFDVPKIFGIIEENKKRIEDISASDDLSPEEKTEAIEEVKIEQTDFLENGDYFVSTDN